MEDLDASFEIFFLGYAVRRIFYIGTFGVEGSEYSEPEPNLWRLDARRPIGRI